MFKFKKISIFAGLFFLVLVCLVWPLGASAAGVVPCAEDCQICDLFVLTQNVLNFVMFRLAPMIAVVLFVWAGFKIVLASTNPGKVSEGFSLMKYAAIGLLLIFGSWMFTNFVMQLLADKSGAAITSWDKIVCKNPTATYPTPTTPPGGGGGPGTGGGEWTPAPECSDMAAVAKKYNEPYPTPTNAPALDSLIGCIKGKMGSAALGEESSFDKKYTSCNFTRGLSICSASCSHRVGSGPYGGHGGTTGALAIDFGNQLIGDGIIHAADVCGAKSARCETNTGKIITGTNPSATHVHVN